MGSNYGEGLASGINSGIGNLLQGVNIGAQAYLGGRRQKVYEDYAEMEKRKQLAAEAQMKGEMAAGQQVDASILASPGAPNASPMKVAPMAPEEPIGMGEYSPSSAQAPIGAVGADALVAPKPMAAPSMPQRDEELSLDELQELSYAYGQKSKEGALSNANDIDSLRAAYHYNAQMKLAKPYLDKWAEALQEVRANPQTPDKWRKVTALTGEDDPARALSLATGEYSKLRQQFDTFQSSYAPLNDYLTSRGITPEMYGDESKFLQFMNQMQFKPHSPRKGALPGASMLGRKPPMPRR